MMTDWQWQTFSQLSGQDQDAHHLLGWRTMDGRRKIVAYLRCLAPGAKHAELGFQSVSIPYDDDGIMHIDMLR